MHVWFALVVANVRFNEWEGTGTAMKPTLRTRIAPCASCALIIANARISEEAHDLVARR